MSKFIRAAYEEVCAEAVKPDGCWLSLYERVPYYGGPEEGGWWGEDVVLMETMFFRFAEDAEAVKDKMAATAKEMNDTATRAYHENCANECDWLEERGLDADFLPEPDGPTKYVVYTEEERGSCESQGCRHYE